MKPSKLPIVLLSILLAGCFEQGEEPRADDAVESQSSAPAFELVGRVTDHANIFSVSQEARISDKLERFESATQHQMVVATVPSLKGRAIAPFTTDLANAWRVGRREHSDGVVVLIAPNERMVRIAVGYGLESTLTDERCAEIIKNEMLPKFRDGDYFTGTDLAIDALIDAMR